MTLLNQADAVYLGGRRADRVYLGADLVWEAPALQSNYVVLPLTYSEDDSANLITWARSGGTAPHVTPEGFEGDGYAARLKSAVLPAWLTSHGSAFGLQATVMFWQQKLRTGTGDTVLHAGADTAGASPNAKLALKVLQDPELSDFVYLGLQGYTGSRQTAPLARPEWRYESRFPELYSGGYQARPQGLLFMDASTLLVSAHYEDRESKVYRIDLATGEVTGEFTFGTSTHRHIAAFAQDSAGGVWCGDFDSNEVLKLDLPASFASGAAAVLATIETSGLTGIGALSFAEAGGAEYVLLAEYASSGVPYLYVIPVPELVDGEALSPSSRYKRFNIGQRVQGVTIEGGSLWVSRNRDVATSTTYGWLERYDDFSAKVLSVADGAVLSHDFVMSAPSQYTEDIKVQPGTGRIWTMTEGWESVADHIGFLGVWSATVDGMPSKNTVTANYDGSGAVEILLNGQVFEAVNWSLTPTVDVVSVGGPPLAAAGLQTGFFAGYVCNVRLQDGAITPAQYAATESGSFESAVLEAYQMTLVNPDAESGSALGWVDEVGGLAVRDASPPPSQGDWYFAGGPNAQTISRQRVDLLAQTGLSDGEVDSGNIWAKQRWLQASYSPQDPGGMGLRKLDALQAQQSLDYNGVVTTPFGGGASGPWYWYQRAMASGVPVGCRYLDSVYRADRDSGTNNDCYIDSITLTVYRQ